MMYRSLILLILLTLAGATCRHEPAPPPADPIVVREVTPGEVAGLLGTDRAPLILDVRTPAEYAEGHVPGALNIPHTEVPAHLDELSAYRDRDVVLYCRSGGRAGLAAGVLKEAGFRRLAHLSGDMPGWAAEGRPVER